MIKDNCIDCMFSEDSEITLWLDDISNPINLDTKHAKCNHINSPYFDELVNDNMSCRLFVDYNKYIKQVDRKQKLDELNLINRMPNKNS